MKDFVEVGMYGLRVPMLRAWDYEGHGPGRQRGDAVPLERLRLEDVSERGLRN